ncbi:MAG: double-strand break repair helicase AddA [Xanthobacteraceae bacterium]|nr:double-strand break repair helicase AddA [Xanthobacteraceae bacterium]
MSARREIPPAVREAQARASDPATSAFVAANAGAGKTHVLVSRVIRLLLSGVAPEKILCITFTKAAAANMAQRVFETLGRWVRLDDAALDAAILAVGAAQPSAKIRERARELFACALETPGGLKVQTIHALCTRLLQQFPFEANVPARFAVLDDRDQNDMMERANLAVLLQASNAPDSGVGRALATAMAYAADVTFKEVVREACLSREHFLAWADQNGGLEAARAQLARALGVTADDRLADIERDIVDGPHLPRARWKDIAAILMTGSKNDHGQADRLLTALDLKGDTQLETYFSVFLTKDLEPRKSLLTKKLGDAQPGLLQTLIDEAVRLAGLLEKRRAVIQRDRTEALLTIASAVAAHYRAEKQQRGLLDYDDLIDKTLAMLTNVSSGWVHYKLDRGVDHVLIDEAQDTSPRQWDIIDRIIAEFTAGEGARDGVKRTIFAVGDEKQSIFSFQGAAPREFDHRRRALERRFTHAGLRFAPVSFTYSFRSGPTILNAVDQVFHDAAIYKSIHAIDNGYPIHEALADAGPSLIDLWGLEKPDERPDIEGWQAPFDAVSETSPQVKLARRVQAEIAALIGNATMTGPADARRRLSYGDILVLVRRREKTFNAVIQALKYAGIPVAGADRLKLTEHVAVIDLMALADALLLPRDDLALAVALKSPLFGLDDDDLLKIAPNRKGSLRAALALGAASDGKLKAAHDRLARCDDHARSRTPFAFYAWLLGGDGGRGRILKRLGPEANDALDEFLDLALNYERKAPATLQGFMAWLRAADTDVKRDMDIGRDEVRVMTVHGAKGLEASVVFMVDTTTSPSDTQRLRLIRVPQGNADPHGVSVNVWAGGKADDPAAVAAARATMLADTEDEYRRLLYVAMTRAADRLIVGGCQPGNRTAVRENSWYDLIAKGLAASDLQCEEIPTAFGPVKRYIRPGDAHETPSPSSPPEAASAVSLPPWLRAPAPADARADRVVRPSDADAGVAHGVRGNEPRERARARGTLAHRLLQSLPDVAPARRGEAARRYLARAARDWSIEARNALAARVLALLDDPRFAAVFAPGSRAEVSIAGRLPRPRGGRLIVSGQIDRLVIGDDTVLIVDYKTDHAPPARPEQAPPGYVRQLALYRAVLAGLYPARRVRVALLWTETLDMMELPAPALDAGLASELAR